MGELSEATGLPVPTVKYYLREGLITPGERTGPNQVKYGPDHVRQLKQVRALLEVGGLSVAQIREVLAGRPLPSRTSTPVADEWALATVDSLARARSWTVGPHATALVEVLRAVRELCPELLENLDSYADLADAAARLPVPGPVATVLSDALLIALRRLAEDPGQQTSRTAA